MWQCLVLWRLGLSHFLLLSSWEALCSALAPFSCFLAADSCFCFSSICNHTKFALTKIRIDYRATIFTFYMFACGSDWGQGGLPWSEGSAWISQRSWVVLSGGYRGWPPHGWLCYTTGFWLERCHQLQIQQWYNAMQVQSLFLYRPSCLNPIHTENYRRRCIYLPQESSLSCCCRVMEAL